MTTQHTDGEWIVEDKCCIQCNGRTIAMAWPNPKAEDGSMYANARLIASAPRLLEALEALRAAVDAGNDYDSFLVAANTSGWNDRHLIPAMRIVEAAVALAKGDK